VDFLDTSASPRSVPRTQADEGVTALYAAQGVSLIRMAFVILGDRGAAEDVVQDAFVGLYRNWDRLDDPANALPYVRSSVLNGCRAALRARARRDRRDRAAARDGWLPSDSAEATVLLSEEHQEVLAAVRKLAGRQRQALTLRYYLGLSTEETAQHAFAWHHPSRISTEISVTQHVVQAPRTRCHRWNRPLQPCPMAP
jgi:RNA polymerase sigma factor (sigma-70 family)